MKILIFADVYYPDVMGGGEFSTKQLTEGLSKKGHKVVVYCLGKNSCEEEINGVRVNRKYIRGVSEHFLSITKNNCIKDPFTTVSKIIRKWPDLYPSRKWYELYRNILLQESPDLVHTVSPVSYQGRLNLWKAACSLKIPVSHVCRGPGLLEFDFFCGMLNRYNASRNAKASAYLTALVAPSKFMLDIHNRQNIKGQRFNEVIYNAVDFNKISVTADLVKQKENLVLYAGAIKKEKGILTLIKAMKELQDVKLLIVGRGKLTEEIEKEGNVEIIDWMDRTSLFNYVKKAKAVILPAEWDEAFGRILIEAIYNGTIGIGSDRGGIPEVLGFDEKYIFTAGNEKELRQRIERVMNMSADEYMEEVAGMQKISAGFTNDEYVNRWENFFLQQLN